MHLELRQEPPLQDDALLMLHMGVGNARQTAKNVFDNHDAWLPVTGRGRFTVSAYAAPNERARTAILSAMPHKQYGEASVATIRAAEVEIVATNTIGVPELLRPVQTLHYSLVVCEGFDSPVSERDEQERSTIEAELETELARVLQLFEPRVANPLRATLRRD